MMKLYCFLYYIKENQVYRQEHDAEENKDFGDYFIRDTKESIYVPKRQIDNPQTTNGADGPIIFVYTFEDDVNRAMALIHDSIEDAYNEAKELAQNAEKTFKAFLEKEAYIKEKYPTGKKE